VLGALIRRGGITSARRVLDAGCGTGRNLQDYARLGPAAGVDPSASAVEFCRQRGLSDVTEAGVEALPFDDGAFDLVFATDVLEHVDDDVAAMRELRRVVAPGGTLVATVPAYMWLWTANDVALQHRRRYSRPQLAQSAAASGWRPEIATYFNSVLLPPIAVARKLRPKSAGEERAELELTPPLVDRALSLPMQAEAGLIARGANLPAGVSVGMVSRAV
jgi:SAM-dependent methyltransferase